MYPDSDEMASIDFLTWLSNSGVDTRMLRWPSTFESADDRGVGAAASLRSGDEILRIPESIMLVPSRCLADATMALLRDRLRCPHTSGVASLDLDDADDLTLALFILLEVARGLAGSPGQWWAYVRVLPSVSAFECLLSYWDESEVAQCADPELLRTHAETRARAEQEWLAVERATLTLRIATSQGGGCGEGQRGLELLSRVLTQQSLRWALACVHSRAFVNGLGVDALFVCPGTSDLLPLAMVPMVCATGSGSACASLCGPFLLSLCGRCACATTAPTRPARGSG